MKTAIDQVDIVWGRLNSSPLKTEITGSVRRVQRPFNSSAEDIVVNSLPITSLPLQTGIINVNIFVPDLQVSENGGQIGEPDLQRINEIGREAIKVLTDQWSTDFSYTVQQNQVIKDNESASHYMNIRLEFYSINLSN